MTNLGDDLNLNEIDDDFESRFRNVDEKLKPQAENLPNITPPKLIKEKESKRKLVNKGTSLPQYVWDQIRQRSASEDVPQTVILLKALKKDGFEIYPEDLKDKRKKK